MFVILITTGVFLALLLFTIDAYLCKKDAEIAVLDHIKDVELVIRRVSEIDKVDLRCACKLLKTKVFGE